MENHNPLELGIDEADLVEIARRCQAAAPGPWRAQVEGRDFESGTSFVMTATLDFEMPWASPDDVDFIAASKQDIPRLVAEIRRLQAILRDVPRMADQIRTLKAAVSGHERRSGVQEK